MIPDNVYLEVVEKRIGPIITGSHIRKPSINEYNELMKKKCNHHTQDKQLIYDEESFLWDIRRCHVCDKVIGMI